MRDEKANKTKNDLMVKFIAAVFLLYLLRFITYASSSSSSYYNLFSCNKKSPSKQVQGPAEYPFHIHHI